jgi:hypothetical protein
MAPENALCHAAMAQQNVILEYPVNQDLRNSDIRAGHR